MAAGAAGAVGSVGGCSTFSRRPSGVTITPGAMSAGQGPSQVESMVTVLVLFMAVIGAFSVVVSAFT